jgi:hypothetical protein
MAANALPPHAVIQALAASTMPVGSGVRRFFDRASGQCSLEPRPLQTIQPGNHGYSRSPRKWSSWAQAEHTIVWRHEIKRVQSAMG